MDTEPGVVGTGVSASAGTADDMRAGRGVGGGGGGVAWTPMEQHGAQRSSVLKVVRAGFFILILTVALLNAAQSTADLPIAWWVPVVSAAVLIVVALAVDLATPRKKISAISGVFLGLFAGLVATLAFSTLADLLLRTWIEEQALSKLVNIVTLFKVLLGITLCYLGVSAVLQTQDDFRLVIPYVEFAKQIRGPKPLLLDTSALIDARVADLAATGLIQTPAIIPAFVVSELQTLADAHDKLKRAKGRRGLDTVSRLQRTPTLDLTIDETPVPGKAVDQMLVELARLMPAVIVTTDTALNRVATINNVSILNINDVANALKPSLVPGVIFTIALLRPGEQENQGIGYLDDGTMVVVENGLAFVGSESRVEVTSSMQTSAGRLIFAKALDAPEAAGDSSQDGPREGDPGSDGGGEVQSGGEPTRAAFPARTVPAPTAPAAKRGPFPPRSSHGGDRPFPPPPHAPGRNPRRSSGDL